MNSIFNYFPFLFVCSRVFITYTISKFGWSSLASKYKFTQPFVGTRVGTICMYVNLISYRNALILEYNNEGLYIKPIILFRLFHPPILIPWTEIMGVRDKGVLFFTMKQLIIGDPIVAKLKFYNSIFKKFEDELNFRTKL